MFDPNARDKQAAALAAVAEVRDGMVLGLGTGSTAAYAVMAVSDLIRSGLKVSIVATSLQTARLARSVGLTVASGARYQRLDLAIDGVDEIDSTLRAIKGAGGAMLRERIVAAAADRMVVIADRSKWVERIGQVPVPVEVLPFARSFVEQALTELGGEPVLRLRRGSQWRTDQGNLVFDCRFGELDDPVALAYALVQIPGLLGHGLFVTEIDAIYVADENGVTRHER